VDTAVFHLGEIERSQPLGPLRLPNFRLGIGGSLRKVFRYGTSFFLFFSFFFSVLGFGIHKLQYMLPSNETLKALHKLEYITLDFMSGVFIDRLTYDVIRGIN
jgi:hypothetical protein